MRTLIPRLSTLGVAALIPLGLAHCSFAQNNPVTPPAVQPATVPAPMAVSPRTGNPTIQPLNPSGAQPGQTPIGTPGGSPSAATTFQMQTPGGGAPQSAGSVGPPIQQARPFGQRGPAPLNAPLGTANVPVGTVNTPLGRVNAPLGTGLQQAFVPGTGVSVPSAIVFEPAIPQPTIQYLDPAGLYYQSGLRQGDVILSSNGEAIQTQADFERIAAASPSQPLPLIVRRNGREEPIEVRPRQVRNGRAHLGVRFDLDAHNAAMISSVTPGSPADAAGLRPGDIITVINGEPITSYEQVFQFLGSLRPGNQLDIRFTRRVENQTKVTLDSRPLPTQTAGSPPSAPIEQAPAPSASNAQLPPK